MPLTNRREAALDVLLLILIAAALIWPLFHIEYFDNWMSIDGVFISDARFLNGHFPAPGWVPESVATGWITSTRRQSGMARCWSRGC
jgi:hypothetical protein